MKRIEYKEKPYFIPETWDEITLEMQIEAETLVKDLGDELGLIAFISTYTDIPISLIKEGNVAVINEIHNDLAFIYDGYVPKPIESFKHRGHTYYIKSYFVNNQFQDWLSIQNILNNYKDNPINGLPRMIAVIAKREGETLDSYDLDERAKEFMDLPLSTAKDIEAFFLSNSETLSVNMLLSSKEFREELVHMKVEGLRHSINKLKAQSGRFSLTRLQIGALLIYTKYIEKLLVKYSNFIYLEKSTTNSKKT